MTFPAPDKIAQNAAPCTANSAIMNDQHVLEPKYDGWRLLVNITGNGIESWSRAGKSQKGKLPHLEAWLSQLPAGTWIDGEIVAFDNVGMPEWGKAQSALGSNAGDPHGNLVFMAFDLLAFGGLDIRDLPFVERRAALEQAIPIGPHLRHTPQLEALDSEHDRLVAEGYEGSIVKELSKPYASGKRGQGWWKLKANDEMDVVITGFKPGQNSFTGMIGAIEFGQYAIDHDSNCPSKDTPIGNAPHLHWREACYDCGKVKYLKPRGRCSGMTMAQRIDFTKRQQELIGQVISMAYMGIMPSGSPRHPQFKRLRPDKSAKDCLWSL